MVGGCFCSGLLSPPLGCCLGWRTRALEPGGRLPRRTTCSRWVGYPRGLAVVVEAWPLARRLNSFGPGAGGPLGRSLTLRGPLLRRPRPLHANPHQPTPHAPAFSALSTAIFRAATPTHSRAYDTGLLLVRSTYGRRCAYWPGGAGRQEAFFARSAGSG